MAGRQQSHMGIPVAGGGGGGGSSVPADMRPSFDMNAVGGIETVIQAIPPEAQPPAEPAGPPLVPALACAAQACGEALVHIGQDGAAYLRVWERQVLRPHKLIAEDLPLAWRCPRCGTPVTIGGTSGGNGEKTAV